MDPVAAAFLTAALIKGTDGISALAKWRREDRKGREAQSADAELDCETSYRLMSGCAVEWETAWRDAIAETRCGTDNNREAVKARIKEMRESLNCYLQWLEAFRRNAKDPVISDMAPTLETYARDLHDEVHGYVCNWRQKPPEFEPRTDKHATALRSLRDRYYEVCDEWGSTPVKRSLWRPSTWRKR